MNRNLKTLALAMTAVLAIGAMTAASAQAEPKYTSPSYPNTGHGEQPGNRFTVGGQKIECEKTTFEGTLFAASESFTIIPTYSGCKAMLGLPTDVLMNGCHYLFTKPVKIKADQYQTPADLICPAGQRMELRVTFGGVVVCTVTVFPQGPLNGMQMTNETETGDIAIEGGFAGVAYEEVQKACPGEPGVIQNNGVYDLGTMTFDSKSGIKLDIG